MSTGGRRALMVFVILGMLAAAGFFLYASREAAEAQASGSTHAAKVEQALRDAEKMMTQ